MAIGSGLGGQLTYAVESTWGQVTSPTRQLEITEESIDFKVNTKQSLGIGAGRILPRAATRVITTTAAGGDIMFDLPSRGLGAILNTAMGTVTGPIAGTSTTLGANAAAAATTITTAASVAVGDILTIDSAGTSPEVRVVLAGAGTTPTIAALNGAHSSGVTVLVNGGTSAYVQKHTLGSLRGKSLTVQKGVPQLDGTVIPWTFTGMKIATMELSCAVDDIVKAKVGLDGYDQSAATTLATGVLPASDVFSFASGQLAIDNAVNSEVGQVSFTLDNKIKTDLFHLSQLGKKAEQERAAFAEIKGSLTVDHYTQTFVPKFLSQAPATLVLLFSSGLSEMLAVMATVKYDDASPNLKGADVVQYPVPWQVVDNGGTPFQITYVCADSAL